MFLAENKRDAVLKCMYVFNWKEYNHNIAMKRERSSQSFVNFVRSEMFLKSCTTLFLLACWSCSVWSLKFEQLAGECRNSGVIFEILDVACITSSDLRIFRAADFDQKLYCISYQKTIGKSNESDVIQIDMQSSYSYFTYVSDEVYL